ncbi:MAG: AHH domain-containing protein [Solirubrobacterales bacterium]|nr:AHH domain-containing protein [Solirubrobacterales bacterium]
MITQLLRNVLAVRTRRLLMVVLLTAMLSPVGLVSGVLQASANTPPPGKPPTRRPPPCEPVECARIAYKVCKLLGGCKHHNSLDSRWRATRRDPKFGSNINRSGDPRPHGDWQAHHIIPIKDPNAYVAQAIAWKCGIRPNDGINGVWLRGPKLKRGTPGYKRLPASLKRRVYHGDTTGGSNAVRYAQIVNKAMLAAYDRKHRTCIPGAAQKVLLELRGALANGTLNFYGPHSVRH